MSVAVLRPQSAFAGTVRDGHGRWWRVYVAPPRSPYVRAVPLRVTSGTAFWDGIFWPGPNCVEGITPGAFDARFGRGEHYFSEIAELLVEVGRQLPAHDTPKAGAHALLAAMLGELPIE